MNKFKELNRREFEQFLEKFCSPGSLKFRNNKWIGLTRERKPFTVHVKHGMADNNSTGYQPALQSGTAAIGHRGYAFSKGH